MNLRAEENAREFKEASRIATSFKYAANRYLAKLNAQGKLVGRFLAVVQADTNHIRGERIFQKTNAFLLKNRNIGKFSVQSCVFNAFSSKIEDDAGSKSVNLFFNMPLVPATDVRKPKGATHIEITNVLVAIDFSNADNLPIIAEKKEVLSLNSVEAISEIATVPVTVPSDYTVFNLVAVRFSQEVNNVKYPLEAKNLNACFLSDAA